MVIAVAMDSREGDALPWIEAARPTYVTLIDRDHRLAELYGVVNVPQAIWIDERGRIVRPAEPAGAYEGFRNRVGANATILSVPTPEMYGGDFRNWVDQNNRLIPIYDPATTRANPTYCRPERT